MWPSELWHLDGCAAGGRPLHAPRNSLFPQDMMVIDSLPQDLLSWYKPHTRYSAPKYNAPQHTHRRECDLFKDPKI